MKSCRMKRNLHCKESITQNGELLVGMFIASNRDANLIITTTRNDYGI